MTGPGTNDWIICVKGLEEADLRARFPDAELIGISEQALYGRALVGRAFITYHASRSPVAAQIRKMLPSIAAKLGADPMLHILEWPADADGRPRR